MIKQKRAVLPASRSSLLALGLMVAAPLCAEIAIVEAQAVVEATAASDSGEVSRNTPRNASPDVITAIDYRMPDLSVPPPKNIAPAAVGDSDNSLTELFLQLRLLQDEMRLLRGLVEQQSHVIEQFGRQRMDDYLDLDRRIGELNRALPTLATPPLLALPQSLSTDNSDVVELTDKQAYRAARQKIQARQFDQAKTALEEFVLRYTDSVYLPNAYFLIGELHSLDGELEPAQQAFSLVVNRYPQHSKVADAKFKLAKIHHRDGDVKRAKSLLHAVLKDHADSAVANPAREYLNRLR